MCYDRLVNDDGGTASVGDLLRSEWDGALRNGALAGVMVLAVLLFQGAPAWVVALSVGGAVALGTALHQMVLLAGAGVPRASARRRSGTDCADRESPSRSSSGAVITTPSHFALHFGTNV